MGNCGSNPNKKAGGKQAPARDIKAAFRLKKAFELPHLVAAFTSGLGEVCATVGVDNVVATSLAAMAGEGDADEAKDCLGYLQSLQGDSTLAAFFGAVTSALEVALDGDSSAQLPVGVFQQALVDGAAGTAAALPLTMDIVGTPKSTGDMLKNWLAAVAGDGTDEAFVQGFKAMVEGMIKAAEGAPVAPPAGGVSAVVEGTGGLAAAEKDIVEAQDLAQKALDTFSEAQKMIDELRASLQTAAAPAEAA